MDDDELLTVLFVGLAVLIAGVAEDLGVSDAIGALMLGIIVAETRVAPRVEHLVLPLRDAFAAIRTGPPTVAVSAGSIVRPKAKKKIAEQPAGG